MTAALLSGLATLDDVEIENQRVLLRADLDVPVSKHGEVLDDFALRRLVPTLRRLTESGARVIVASEFGTSRRPDKAPPSIEPAAARLSELSGLEVHLPEECLGDSVKKVVSDLREGQICVLENLALCPEDARADEGFARALMAYCDVFVNDALSSCARESATTTVLPRLLEQRVAGPTLVAELEAVLRVLNPTAPFTLVLGGSRLTDKIDALQTLLPRCQHLFVAGVPANTMVRARGGAMGTSHLEENYLAGARTLMDQAFGRLVLPEDFVAAASVKAATGRVVAAGELDPGEAAVDLGPKSRTALAERVALAKTVLWWGTVGFHKNPAFAEGTRALVEALADSSAFTLVVGDDSVAAAHAVCPDRLGDIDCLAGGGSATLALLAGKKLPGLEALRGMGHD
jgi:phosphoglycerate kinase